MLVDYLHDVRYDLQHALQRNMKIFEIVINPLSGLADISGNLTFFNGPLDP